LNVGAGLTEIHPEWIGMTFQKLNFNLLFYLNQFSELSPAALPTKNQCVVLNSPDLLYQVQKVGAV